MKKVLGVFLLFISIFYAAHSQAASSGKSRELTERANALLQQGKLDEAIEAADQVVGLEKDSKSADTSSYANALLNLARMKQGVFAIIRDQLKNRKIEPRSMESASKKASESAKEADALYRQALQLNEQGGRGQTTQTADIKYELGGLLYKYIGSRESIDDSEKFLLESLELNEKLRGKDSDQTLFVVLKAGDFYNEMNNYEKASMYYERFIQTGEKTHGDKYPDLVNALRPYAKILYATYQEQAANDALKRIEEISGKPEQPPKADLSFHLRSKTSVAESGKFFTAYQKDFAVFKAKRNEERNSLSGNTISMMPRVITVLVNVVVDESGKITEAAAALPPGVDKDLKEKAEQEVSKWDVRPFSYNGQTRKLRGVLYYRSEQFAKF